MWQIIPQIVFHSSSKDHLRSKYNKGFFILYMWSTITANNDVRKRFGLNLVEGHILDFLYTSEVNNGDGYCEDGYYTKGGTIISRTLYLNLWDVKRALRNLEKLGLIERNEKGHRKTSDEYKGLVKEKTKRLKVVSIKHKSNELAANI